MDESLNLPCEPRLSNSIFKNRVAPSSARIGKKPKRILASPTGGKLFIKMRKAPTRMSLSFIIRIKYEYLQ